MTIKLGYADGEVWVCEGCDYPEMYTPEPVCECKPGAKPRLVRRLSFVDAPGHETLMNCYAIRSSRHGWSYTCYSR
jgi:translation initiation factor 2 subunit 3